MIAKEVRVAGGKAGLGAVLSLALAACSASSGDGKAEKRPGSSSSPGGEGGGSAGEGPILGSGGAGGSGTILETGGKPSSDGGTQGCAKASVRSNLLPSNILFVVDRSGGMNCNLPPITASADCDGVSAKVDQTQPSKWEILATTLGDAFKALPADTGVGLSFFSNDDICGVQSAPNVGINLLTQPQVDALTFSLQNAIPRGGTPLVGAVILAYKHLHEQAKAPGNRFVVLVTDGTDSCANDYAQTVGPGDMTARLLNQEIPKARSVNIRTFVMGAPGSEVGRSLLSEIAFAGGTARDPTCEHGGAAPDRGDCHFDMTKTTDFAADLAKALDAISGRAALTCEFAVPEAEPGKPVDPTLVNVDYFAGGKSKVEIYKDESKPCEGGADGWQYTDDTHEKIVLCGPRCTTVREDPEARVDIVLGCESRIR